MYSFNFDLDQFMKLYWHEQPILIRRGFTDFKDPVSADELAGLAMEQDIDSRLVSNANDDWRVEHGPFDETTLTQLPSSHWQLLIQASNHWHPEIADLAHAFSALPQWLFDDVMSSFSTQGGGVGPHIDQYDVFIVQGSGERRWRVGPKDQGQYQANHRASALKQIDHFDAIIDEILYPGDILYIPPGFPHEAVSITDSMSYSVGYRSPNTQELMSHFADHLIEQDIAKAHWHAPDLMPSVNHGEISPLAMSRLTDMMTAQLKQPHVIAESIGIQLSLPRHSLNIIEPETPWQSDELYHYLSEGGELYKVSGLKSLYYNELPDCCFIHGEAWSFSSQDQWAIDSLCNHEVFGATQGLTTELVLTLTELVNRGFWYLDEGEEE